VKVVYIGGRVMRKGGKSGSGKKELPVEARTKGRMPKRIMAATERVLADRPEHRRAEDHAATE
jgi:hypothetical protein